MLPHVDAKDGNLSANHGILVLGSDDPQSVAILDQPAPATSLNAQKSLHHGLLEFLQAAPGFGNLSSQSRGAGRIRIRRRGGRQVHPKQRVVDVAAAVELDGSLQGNLRRHVVGSNGGGVGLESTVQVGDIGLVMLAVVKLHDLCGDAGLESLDGTD